MDLIFIGSAELRLEKSVGTRVDIFYQIKDSEKRLIYDNIENVVIREKQGDTILDRIIPKSLFEACFEIFDSLKDKQYKELIHSKYNKS